MAGKRRGGGRAGRRSLAATRATPQDPSDSEMQDAPPSGQVTPAEERAKESGEGHDGDEAEDDEDDGATPLNESEGPSRSNTPARARSSTIPQKRRAGRPARTRPRDGDGSDEDDSRAPSDMGTPKRRGGWRGRGFGGGRWGKPRGGPSHTSQVPLDKEGNVATVKDDEVELSEDAEGEKKVNRMGHLQGGREYRVRVFTISSKGERLYMLSTEPARCIGFRDSYLFFQKHRQLFKIIVGEDDKRDLIERNIIPHSYKGRAIGVVTARSVYREFGAKIIIGGKKVTDDYQVAAARARGDVEGTLAVPEDHMPTSGKLYDKNRYVAWHGASSVYHSGIPSIPVQSGKTGETKKRKVHVTGINWMFEHAREASHFNSTLTRNRRLNNDGVYEPHTNVMQYPKAMQPTHASWKQLPVPSNQASGHDRVTNGSDDVYSNGLGSHTDSETGTRTLFGEVTAFVARNFATVDTYYVGPPLSNLGVPGPDGDSADVGAPGLVDVSEDVLAELPEECAGAFREARQQEMAWRTKWGTESQSNERAHLSITYSGLLT